ncbi:MAG: endonuclease SmrB [Buchnera aphidicola (Eriosoma harunire)]
MDNKNSFLLNESLIFQQWVGKLHQIKQDTIFLSHIVKKNSNHIYKRRILEQSAHVHYFSNDNTCVIPIKDPICYLRKDVDVQELNKLKYGEYVPEIVLDLHGFTQTQAKQELGNLFFVSEKENCSCACVIHGHGKDILKKQVPLWLSKHPSIKAFHVAPKHFGYNAAIILLIDINK